MGDKIRLEVAQEPSVYVRIAKEERGIGGNKKEILVVPVERELLKYYEKIIESGYLSPEAREYIGKIIECNNILGTKKEEVAKIRRLLESIYVKPYDEEMAKQIKKGNMMRGLSFEHMLEIARKTKLIKQEALKACRVQAINPAKTEQQDLSEFVAKALCEIYGSE